MPFIRTNEDYDQRMLEAQRAGLLKASDSSFCSRPWEIGDMFKPKHGQPFEQRQFTVWGIDGNPPNEHLLGEAKDGFSIGIDADLCERISENTQGSTAPKASVESDCSPHKLEP